MLAQAITDRTDPKGSDAGKRPWFFIQHPSKLKPRIPLISQILKKLSGMSVRIFTWQNLQGIDNRNLLYPCVLRNLWLNTVRLLG